MIRDLHGGVAETRQVHDTGQDHSERDIEVVQANQCVPEPYEPRVLPATVDAAVPSAKTTFRFSTAKVICV